MAYAYEEELFALVYGLMSGIPALALSIASYVLTSLAVYTIARRRGLNKPWLAWIPVLNVWLIGSLSDQYQYVVKRQNKSKRKVLLVLSLLMAALTVVIAALGVSAVGAILFGSYRYSAGLTAEIWRPVMLILGCCLPLIGVALAYAVVRYMAMYDVYKSLDPNNCVLYLVLSILFGVTEPFFLFFNRNKDTGMPPRRQEPVWEAGNKDYL